MKFNMIALLLLTAVSSLASEADYLESFNCPVINGITCGQKVMEDFQSRSFQTVTAMSNGLFYLSDKGWYSPQFVHPMVEELGGIHVGDTVMEDYESRSIQTVISISNGIFYLSDKLWYQQKYVHIVECQK